MQAILDEIGHSLLPRLGEGKIASYIPELAKIDPLQFGLVVHPIDGIPVAFGDADVLFSIQMLGLIQ